MIISFYFYLLLRILKDSLVFLESDNSREAGEESDKLPVEGPDELPVEGYERLPVKGFKEESMDESEDESDVETIEKEILELKDLGKEAQDAEILDSLLPDNAKPFNSHLKKAKEWYERVFDEDWVNPRKAAKDIKERIKALEAPVKKKDITNESIETNPFATKSREANSNTKPDSSNNSPLEPEASQTISENTNPCDASALEPQSVLDMAEAILEKII